MRILIYSLFLIANLGYNSKASFDSFAPYSSNVLLEDTTRNSDNSCNRPCKFNVKPRRCHYTFKIEPTIQDGVTTISVNGMTPGPPIQVCVRDIIVVEVQNKVPDQDVAIHWHGLEQRGTPYMDGVPMVTQCPITYGSTFKYAFRASTPGTFFYHSDSVNHQSDGVFGALIVRQPSPMEPHAGLYDFDRSDDNTLVISARFPQLLTANLEGSKLVQPTFLTVNGDSRNFKIFVIPKYAYRLRLINAIAAECPVDFDIEGHEMLVIASDGRPVKPAASRTVRLYPGERMDVVVRASQNNGGYRIGLHSGECGGITGKAMFLYTGFNYTSMLTDNQQEQMGVDNSSPATIGQQLESYQGVPLPANIKPVYLGIDRNIVNFKETDNDFRYVSDAIPKKPFFPATLSLQENGVVQINKKSFLYPNTPLLLKSKKFAANSVCGVGYESEHQEPQCLLSLNADEGQVLELALVNEGFGSNDSYTFHMHGPSMQVLATWQTPDNTPLSREAFQRLDTEGKIIRNLEFPPLKDTIVVPNKGYVIVRIKADQGGSWLLECRSCSLFSLPAAIVLNVPLSLPKSISDLLPRCGNYRPPDVLLN